MKHLLYFAFALIPNLLFGQCDINQVYNNDSTHSVCIDTSDNVIIIHSNNIPNHAWGTWPSGNPVNAQDFTYNVCINPQKSSTPTSIYDNPSNTNGCTQYTLVGVGLNGIFYAGWGARWFVNPNTQQENLNWNVEPSAMFNMDFNTAHSNSDGEYHYHGTPFVYLQDSLQINGSTHSPLIGYAADGFPIYYKYAYTDAMNPNSGLSSFTSGYTLKSGNRPGNGITAPDGTYDGLYVEDYEYSANNWPLDDCNGRFGVTPEYPNGTYYYMITDNWPYYPRCFYGTVIDNSFRIGPNCPSSTADIDCSPAVHTDIPLIENINLSIFPNPTGAKISITTNNSEIKINAISLYDINGKVYYHSKSTFKDIDLTQLPNGNYFIQITSGEHEITKKIIKK